MDLLDVGVNGEGIWPVENTEATAPAGGSLYSTSGDTVGPAEEDKLMSKILVSVRAH